MINMNNKTNNDVKFKSGFVSIVGRPNVGKSTLMNTLIGEKIAIMSDKPQTTRNQIRAIYNSDEIQIVFMDTPGIQKPKNKLGSYMMKASSSSMKDTDIILFVVDESKRIGATDKEIIENLKNNTSKKILVINKIDKINKEELMDLINMYSEIGIFDEIVPVSAIKGENSNTLIKVLSKYLEEGPQYFPKDMITDQPEKVLVSEIIREKILMYTDQEIPHGIAVEIEQMKKRKDKDIIDVSALIYCEREAHKKIIIGHQGRKIKGIGKSAREELEFIFGNKVFLELWVKAKPNWRDKENFIRTMGFDDNK